MPPRTLADRGPRLNFPRRGETDARVSIFRVRGGIPAVLRADYIPRRAWTLAAV